MAVFKSRVAVLTPNILQFLMQEDLNNAIMGCPSYNLRKILHLADGSLWNSSL
jgi:hypothetical protein